MTREESADALELILNGDPSPAQIGAFMIAHRIRRPEPQELAGMVDTYLKLGPKLYSENNLHPPICFGMPFDGRKKTSPIYPLTTLLLLDASQPVILQGAGRLPVKYGVTTEELFKGLGLCLGGMDIQKVQDGFSEHGLALIYQPDHFPLADSLINYREEIGKRPPIASMELIWSAHQGEHILISGFVHTPTEDRHIKTLRLLDEQNFIMVNGLEGGIDIPTSRISNLKFMKNQILNDVKINPREYSMNCKDLEFDDIATWRTNSFKALQGEGPLYKALVWNAGIYLWFAGAVQNISIGMKKAEKAIQSGSAKKKLNQLIAWRNK